MGAVERSHPTTEKECLAVVWAALHLRSYQEGAEFTIRTDHHALRLVLNLSEPQERLARWRLRLLEFESLVEYRAGAQHHAADYLHRSTTDEEDNALFDTSIPCFAVGGSEMRRG